MSESNGTQRGRKIRPAVGKKKKKGVYRDRDGEFVETNLSASKKENPGKKISEAGS